MNKTFLPIKFNPAIPIIFVSRLLFASEENKTHTHVIRFKNVYDPRVLVMGIVAFAALIIFLWLKPHSSTKKNKNRHLKTKRKRGKGMKLPY
ncbi:MAG: hypothetical protein B7Y39_12515 [Bdellovibrio sp. 28-41-41]|nr:MAG: hypothetical protein B7Y39_12515 [Bdellovibrio sp. 28-41-41]